jgi:hypothetical protein
LKIDVTSPSALNAPRIVLAEVTTVTEVLAAVTLKAAAMINKSTIIAMHILPGSRQYWRRPLAVLLRSKQRRLSEGWQQVVGSSPLLSPQPVVHGCSFSHSALMPTFSEPVSRCSSNTATSLSLCAFINTLREG